MQRNVLLILGVVSLLTVAACTRQDATSPGAAPDTSTTAPMEGTSMPETAPSETVPETPMTPTPDPMAAPTSPATPDGTTTTDPGTSSPTP
jgi:hypothetical protein